MAGTRTFIIVEATWDMITEVNGRRVLRQPFRPVEEKEADLLGEYFF